MESVPEMTNEGTPALGEPFVFPSYGNIGPPHIATLSFHVSLLDYRYGCFPLM
jgi:hypothetical protein